MLAAHEQPLVLAAESDVAEAIRIRAQVRRAPLLFYEVFVIDAVGRPGNLRLVKPFRVRSMHFVLGGPFSEQAQDDASGVRHERAHGGPLPASGGLRTEDAVRHVMPREPIQLAERSTGSAEPMAGPVGPVPSALTAQEKAYPSFFTDPAAAAAIAGGYHSTPFDILGIHRHTVDGKPAIVIRTFQPQALTVSVLRGFQAYPMHRIHQDGSRGRPPQ